MPYVLGVDVGRTSGAAAVGRHDGRPEVVVADLPPLLAVANEEMVVGAAALAVSAERVASDLLDHIGDNVPVLLGDVAYTAHDLLAALVAALADQVSETEGAPPDRVAVTHPPDWGTYRRGLLRDALASAGYPGALLLPTVVAAAEAEHCRLPLRPGQTLAVALLGGRHVEYALLTRGPNAFDLVEHTASADPAAGAALDDLLHDLGGQAVKERLSTTDEVHLADTVITRTAFADLARPVLTRTVDGFHSFLTAHRPDRAVIAGGTARVPLLHILAAALPTPTAISDDPATVPARGAALAARPRPGLPSPRSASSDPGFRPVGSGFSHPSVRSVDAAGSDPALPPVVGGGGPDGGRRGGSDPALPLVAGRAPGGSDPGFRPVPLVGPAFDKIDTVVSHPGFPPVRLPVDAEPPPRPPVEIKPLEVPVRRFARGRDKDAT